MTDKELKLLNWSDNYATKNTKVQKIIALTLQKTKG